MFQGDYAATAGSMPDGAYEAQDSLCPSGWHLPANSGDDSFYNLFQVYPAKSATNVDTVLLSAPLGFLRSGFYLSYRSSYGYYWSRTTSSSTGGYGLYFRSAYLNPQYSFDRGNGFSVRCLAH